jgi:hypothetical protein
MSPGVNTVKSKVGMLMIVPGPPGCAAAAVWAFTYGDPDPAMNSGRRKFAPEAGGFGPLPPYCSVAGSTVLGTM